MVCSNKLGGVLFVNGSQPCIVQDDQLCKYLSLCYAVVIWCDLRCGAMIECVMSNCVMLCGVMSSPVLSCSSL
eukprot:5578383-Pyramimonas_sp.AAC.1